MNYKRSNQRGIYSEVLQKIDSKDIRDTSNLGPSKNIVRKPIVTQYKIRSLSRVKLEAIKEKSENYSHNRTMPEGYYSMKRSDIAWIDPKIQEPIENAPGKAPRRVILDRRRKEFNSQSVEEELKNFGIDFSTPDESKEAKLPLEAFDDDEQEVRTPQDWLDLATDEDGTKGIPAKAIHLGPQRTGTQELCFVRGFNHSTEEYIVDFEAQGKRVSIHKLYIVFIAEDQRNQAKRLQQAQVKRKECQDLLAQNYQIEKMPILGLPSLTDTQQLRIYRLLRSTKIKQPESNPLCFKAVQELLQDQARMQNKMIFNVYMPDCGTNILGRSLSMPTNNSRPACPTQGKVYTPLTQAKFQENQSDFCFKTLYIKSEVIEAMTHIKKECDRLARTEHFYKVEADKLQRLEEYKQVQKTQINVMKSQLTHKWNKQIEDLVREHIVQIGKGWFNMRETVKETQEFSKLKKLLTIVKQMMQDALLRMATRCVRAQVDSFKNLVPRSVTIKSCTEVINNQNNDSLEDSVQDPDSLGDAWNCLFSIEVLEDTEHECFVYNIKLGEVTEVVCDVFKDGIKILGEVDQVERRLLKELFKTSAQTSKVKVPKFGHEEPRKPTYEEMKAGAIPDENSWLWDAQHELADVIATSIGPAEEYLQQLQRQSGEIGMNPEEYFDQLYGHVIAEIAHFKDDDDRVIPEEEKVPLAYNLMEIRNQLAQQLTMKAELESVIPDVAKVGMYQINCKQIKHKFTEKHKNVSEKLKNMVQMIIKWNNNEVRKYKDKVVRQLSNNPTDIRELNELRRYMDTLPTMLHEVQSMIEVSSDCYELLDEYLFVFRDEDLMEKLQTQTQARNIVDLRDKKEIEMENKKKVFLEQLREEQIQFESDIKSLQENVDKLSRYQDIERQEDYAVNIMELDKLLAIAQSKSHDYNEQENLFGLGMTKQEIKSIIKKFDVYKSMWLTTRDWKNNYQKWMNCDWQELSGEEVEKEVLNQKASFNKCKRIYRDDPEFQMLVQAIDIFLNDIREFEGQVPLAVFLRVEGMNDRHWEELSREVQLRINPKDKNFNLKRVIRLGLTEYIQVIEDISIRASKEHGIRRELDKMYREWRALEYQFTLLKNTQDVFIIKNFEDCLNINDEHIGSVTNLYQSPQKDVFDEEINKWKGSLELVSEVLEKWMKLQIQQMYLQPIFTSGDIKKSLQQYQKMFKQVDNRWKQNMTHARRVINVMDFSNNETLRDNMTEDILILDKVQKNLENQLTIKRSNFSRLQFLSDDELLKILSNTKEPRNINDQLKKIFESMEHVRFSDHTTITHMSSKEGEVIMFNEAVDPKDNSVEIWCKLLEAQMVETMRLVINESIIDQEKIHRKEWVKKWYSQCVLTTTQFYFTRETEQSIAMFELTKYRQKCNQQILDLVDLVRTKLSNLEKKNISPLIVQGVHERDIIVKLEKTNITNINEFEWVSQLRQYLDLSGGKDSIICKCMQTVQPQGYEYMGNADRLVITPLTDKCYMTLMGALKLNLGGAPSGPAGTGKTETTKDLSKNLAKLCKVFNCGPEMEYKMIGTFFKGLASCGAWCCFDEFNRISQEVLSVVAQQLQTLLNEKSKGVGETTTQFLETEIKVLGTFSVFITMNPTYKGRQQLPDNLKALFRPVAMMVPDYKSIAEIFLYSQGFVESNLLAGKLVETFILCSEQLSKQNHYDQGLRAVRSTINNAGLLKRKDNETEESSIVLKALIDINLPKFLKHDIPLFNNILQDLFPDTEQIGQDLGTLKESIANTLAANSYFNSPEMFDKIKQLQDTIKVRHGVMIVGPTGSGKTVNYRTLREAINRIAIPVDPTKEEKNSTNFRKVVTRVLNPKSIMNEQIQGQMNQITKEQSRGLVPVIFNKAVEEVRTEHLQWILFDGPVDSMWIESMNSCLDDSKKLCLPNSEIIDMTDQFTVMFEVDNLMEASPATISRCGMVQMDPKALLAEHVFFNFTKRFPEAMKDERFTIRLHELFENLFEKCMQKMRRECTQMVLTSENNQALSFLNIINSLCSPAKPNEFGEVNQVEVEKLIDSTELMVLYALIWSIGGNTNEEGRVKFDKALKEIVKEQNSQPNIIFKLPELGEDSYQDYQVDFQLKELKHIRFITPEQAFQKISQDEIVVPTDDTFKLLHVSSILIKSNCHVLKCGGTGTGKSINCDHLLNDLNTSKQSSISITFNARTSVNALHAAFAPRLKRRKLGVLGPENNKKALVLVDDLNMPKKETQGAQPVLELVRQWFDHQGWQDMGEFEFKYVVDIFFLAAMGLPGGGRSVISERLVRHFNIIGQVNMTNNAITQIFYSITSGFQEHCFINEEDRQKLITVAEVTVKAFQEISRNFLPIPKKSHYLFNLRDLSKVFQGLCLATPKTFASQQSFEKLWAHEMCRVFRDRLVETKDELMFDSIINEHIETYFEVEEEVEEPKEKVKKEEPKEEHVEGEEEPEEEVIQPKLKIRLNKESRILFGDFMDKEHENKTQREIDDLSKLSQVLEETLEDQNNENQPMNLILFSDCCEHISRLCRILGFPRGNALLMGVGGSGRQSCTKLANYTMGAYKLQQIEITKDYKIDKNWREDLKTCLLMAGSKRITTTFLLVDTQFIGEKMLEDVNNILNTADVPNLQSAEDIEDMNKVARRDCQERGLEQTPGNLFNMQLNAVKKNIHIVLAMSQMGENFRSNLLNFPSLINCNTIDQYSEWPEDALISVARVQLTSESLDLGAHTNDIIQMFSVIHKSVEITSKQYEEELRRHNQVTPTSYLELINMYKSVITQKRLEFDRMISRYKIGLNIIDESQNKTLDLQRKIKEEEPKLQDLEILLTKQNETLSIILDETNKKKEEVMIASKDQNIKVEQLERMNEEIRLEKVDTEREKDEAYKLAEKLNVKDITEVSSQTHPPDQISQCMKLIVLMFDEEKEVKNKEDLAAWFQVCKNKLLRNVTELKDKLKQRLKEEKITERQQKKIEPHYERSKFETNFQETISGACVKLAGWVRAMRSIQLTNVKLAPILQKLTEGEKKLQDGQLQLDKLNREKDEFEKRCSKLQKEAEECLRKKEETQVSLELNKQRLVRANKLLSGLKDEKSRWNEEVKRMSEESRFLIGNCIIASGMMSQGGPFDSSYRKKLLAIWVDAVKANFKFPLSENVNLINVIGNKVRIENWKALQNLPNDDLSIENGIILDHTSRWPLCIDPQNQASSFIKKQGFDTKKDLFKVMKATDEKVTTEIEMSIKFGKWLIIENMGEKISTDFESILSPQIRVKGKTKILKFGDKEIEQNDDFKLYFITTMPNPHYSPETCVKICIINFAITELGLKDQMLSLAVSIEKQELEAERNKLIETNAQNEKKLEEKEDEILEDLKKSNPERILDEDDLINKLQNTKEEANRINKDQESAKEREEKIKVERNKQQELAIKVGILFFTLTDMVNIDHMYQQSLKWYKDLFFKAAEEAEQNPDDETRIRHIYWTFLKKLYSEVCRTLFEKDKLLFSFNITIKLQVYNGEVDPTHFRQFLTGQTEDLGQIQDAPDWVDKMTWERMQRSIQGLEQLNGFEGFRDYFFNNLEKFKRIYTHEDPRKVSLPGEWEEKLESFQKMLVFKALRPDFLVTLIRDFIRKKMDKHFVEPPLFRIEEGQLNSSKETPIIFIITPGSDPLADLKKFSDKRMGKELKQLSLGQGQGKQASALFKKFSEDGTWLLFQNTHLQTSWLPTLERLIEELKKPDIHPEFRLFLTTASSDDFPIAILQEGVKMTVETSGDVKQMMLNSYQNYTDEYMDSCNSNEIFKSLLFGITLFHSLLIDRKKFGPIGWNNHSTYDFSNEDLNVTRDQLQLMLEESNKVEFKVLRFNAAVINQGGRVTDDKDERFIMTFAKLFMNEEMIGGGENQYQFDENKKQALPQIGIQEDYKEFIQSNYDQVTPELFGLHPNSDLLTNQNVAEALLQQILSIQPRTVDNKSGKSQEDVYEERANQILERVPVPFDLENLSIKFPTDYKESMNTVLTQEAQRQNELLHRMLEDLNRFKDANRGRIVMNEQLDKMGVRMLSNEVPMQWTSEDGLGFLSTKQLANWVNDLRKRIGFLREWEEQGTPIAFWMSGLFEPQAFLTGIKQNYARKNKIPIDLVDFEFVFINDKLEKDDVKEAASEGCYIQGQQLEGAGYDQEKGVLVTSNPRELNVKLPVLHLKPTDSKGSKGPEIYQCPIYKTSARHGQLSTTGHSSNCVMYMDIQTDVSEDKWILAGVAAVLSLKNN